MSDASANPSTCAAVHPAASPRSTPWPGSRKQRPSARARCSPLAVSGRGLVDPASPCSLADDEGFTRGRAAFETMRVYGGRPFRLDEHLARLAASAERIGLPLPTQESASAWPRSRSSTSRHAGRAPAPVLDARATGRRRRVAIALVSADPGLDRGAACSAGSGSSRCSAAPVGAVAARRARSRRATPSTWPPRPRRRRRGADDAVFVDADGIVLEGPVTNIWWREGDVLVTPSLELGILAGETRAALLELAAGRGYAVEEGAYPLARLARRRRGVHLVVGPRGDARRGGRRPSDPARPRRGRPAGRAAASGAGLTTRATSRPRRSSCPPSTTRCAQPTGSSRST